MSELAASGCDLVGERKVGIDETGSGKAHAEGENHDRTDGDPGGEDHDRRRDRETESGRGGEQLLVHVLLDRLVEDSEAGAEFADVHAELGDYPGTLPADPSAEVAVRAGQNGWCRAGGDRRAGPPQHGIKFAQGRRSGPEP